MGIVLKVTLWTRNPIVSLRICSLPLWLAVTVAFGANEPQESGAKLPSDGAWVRYKVELQAEQDGVPSRNEFVGTISLVGTVTEKDQPCRWIEIKTVAFDAKGAASRTHVTKLLIPEMEMLKSKNPLKQAVRGWVRVDEGPATPMGPINFDPGLFVGESLSWLPGGRALLHEVDQPRDIEYQRGKLKGANALSGTREYTKADAPELGKHRWKSTFTIWRHADLPCGFAHAVIEAEKWFGDDLDARLTMTYHLEDAGADAKSGLPESN